MNFEYELIVIGSGMASYAFVSSILKKGYQGKIAIVETGRGLGGRFSTRYSSNNKKWRLKHGAPNFNISNLSKSSILENFINELLENNLIRNDDSLFIEFDKYDNFKYKINNDFYKDNIYFQNKSNNKFLEKLIEHSFNKNQIDFYFRNLINKINFNKNKWTVFSDKGLKLKANYLIISSNLLLHKRSKEILKKNQIPLREAIPINEDPNVDRILYLTNKQKYLKRTNLLIYTKENYQFKFLNHEKNIHFLFNEKAERHFGLERIIFQLQIDKRIGIVIHTRNLDSINEEFEIKDKEIQIKYLLSKYNNFFERNKLAETISDFEDIAIMNWRASQPLGTGIPKKLQICKNHNLFFCGDWFDFKGFGKIEGAILSGLTLSEKFLSIN